MLSYGLFQIAAFFLLIVLCTKPLGTFMANVYEGRPTFLHPVLQPLERLIYKLCGVSEEREQRWTQYAGALLAFSGVSMTLTYLIERIQHVLPWNPEGIAAMTPDLAFNTAASFTTNTNWQSYVPETAASYFTEMLGLATHNFFSAAAGMAIAVALVRGFARQSTDKIGNFWVDMTRSIVYILLPISLLMAVAFASQGVIQNFSSYTRATTVEGVEQKIAQGPIASQEAIKMLGTNGGGFTAANSAHPFENPTPLANFIQIWSIFVIPAALTYTFGKMVGNTRQGWSLFAAMSLLFFMGLAALYAAESYGNPLMAPLGVEAHGNMEGKEVRFGVAASALFATVTTDASCGAVNSMHDSFTPLGGLVPMINMQLGEAVFGGTGAGLYGMLMYAILAVFIAGLMVGRTPEYLGKKIEQKEVKMVMLAVLVVASSILLPAGITAVFPTALKQLSNPGAHGLSEILYAYTSASANNGSAFGGLNANVPWFNISLAISMLFGRFLMIVPLLAVAGSLAQKKLIPESAGTLPTTGPLFVVLLTGVVLIVGALTFFPALALGPVVEHFQMIGR